MASSTVVLVPGAWHGAWCWRGVIDRLTDQGIRAIALDLPSGTGVPDADLHSDVDVACRALDNVEDVVLVGHSYGGAVITEAGIHPNVRELVYTSQGSL